MSDASSASLNPPNATAENYCDRKHRLAPPKTLSSRLGLALQDLLKSFIAKVSVHADPPIYETKTFPWAAELETDWKKIRAELDAVMVYHDQMPSFQDILREVSTIQTDNDWKTFFLAGIGMDCRENAARCPETMRLLGRIPGMATAFFSILSPQKHIPACSCRDHAKRCASASARPRRSFAKLERSSPPGRRSFTRSDPISRRDCPEDRALRVVPTLA